MRGGDVARAAGLDPDGESAVSAEAHDRIVGVDGVSVGHGIEAVAMPEVAASRRIEGKHAAGQCDDEFPFFAGIPGGRRTPRSDVAFLPLVAFFCFCEKTTLILTSLRASESPLFSAAVKICRLTRMALS